MADLASRLNTALSGRYAIQRELGAGGMGQVFLADDLRHHHAVAIKVLRPDLATALGPERFLREIQIAARLYHPHVLPLHDSGSADGLLYYVMPYAEGGSLRRKLAAAGQLPLAEALQIAREVADALDFVHRRGVVHRDIKPENIFFQERHAVVADFGLARAVQAAGGKDLTGTGVVVGTPAYMSPEQTADSKKLDGRSDLYSLGCVLYEMLAGQPPFTGPTAVSITHQHRNLAPRPVTHLRPTVPAEVERVVERALAKSPADRFDSAAEFRAALPAGGADIAGAGPVDVPAASMDSGARTVAMPSARRPSRPWRWGLLGGAALIAVVGGLWAIRHTRPERPRTPTPGHGSVRFTFELPRGLTAPAGIRRQLAISPDGSRLVFGAFDGTKTQLYMRSMGEAEARPIAGTEGAVAPFFSPDGEWMGFFTRDGSLWKERASGGEPVALAKGFRTAYVSACWGPDGTIVVGSARSPLLRVPETGGAAQAMVARAPDERHNLLDPEVLPGGRTVLFTEGTGDTRTRIDAMDLRSGARRVLIEDGSRPRYLDAGYLVFCREDTLYAVAFDARRVRAKGAPVPVLGGVAVAYFGAVPHVALSRSGSLAYIPSAEAVARRSLVRVDRSGTATPFPVDERGYLWCRLTLDGSWLAVGTFELEDTGIWVTPLDRFALARLPFRGYVIAPIWHPDGKRLAFAAAMREPETDARRGWELYLAPRDGSAPPEHITDSPYAEAPTSWTTDGRYLVLEDWSNHQGVGILPWSESGGARDTVVFVAPGGGGVVSPDGRWLAFSSAQSGRDEIYAQRFPGGEGRRQVSARGGLFPAWSPRGDELFYVRGYPPLGRSRSEPSGPRGREEPEFIAVSVKPGADVAFGSERVLFSGEFAYGVDGVRCYDVGPGARWFVMPTADHATGPTAIQVVFDWADAIERRFESRE